MLEVTMNFIRGLFESEYFSSLHQALVILHVAAALMALIVAPVAMIATKGGRTHAQWGRVYFWAMFITNLSAMWLLYWRFNIFLFGVVATSFYSSLTGYRAIYRKHSSVQWFDWASTAAALLIGVALIGWGALTALGITSEFIPAAGSGGMMAAILPLVFGLVISGDARTDIALYRNPSPDRRWWWYYHMERMLGSYIGLSTALMVQQVAPRLPENIAWLAWVAPSAIGVPLVVTWIAHYRQKFGKQKRAMPVQAPLSST